MRRGPLLVALATRSHGTRVLVPACGTQQHSSAKRAARKLQLAPPYRRGCSVLAQAAAITVGGINFYSGAVPESAACPLASARRSASAPCPSPCLACALSAWALPPIHDGPGRECAHAQQSPASYSITHACDTSMLTRTFNSALSRRLFPHTRSQHGANVRPQRCAAQHLQR